MGKVPDKDLEGYLTSARDMANGTLLMNVVVEDHQLDDAQAWMKGKRKVKNLTILSRSEHDTLQKKRDDAIKKRRAKIKQE